MLVDLHALGAQRGDCGRFVVGVELALVVGGGRGFFQQHLLVLRLERIKPGLIHQHHQRRIGVARHRDVLLHLVHLGRHHQRGRVFLAVHRTGFQRAEDLGERHRLRARTQQLEGLDMRRVGRGADLQAADVLGLVDGPFVVTQAAEADFPEGQALDAVRAQLVEQREAHRAVQHLVGRRAILELVGQVENVQARHQTGDKGIAGGTDVDGAAAHARDQRGVVAELAVGKDLDLDTALRALLDLLAEGQRGLMLRIGFRNGMGKAQLDGRLRGGHAGDGQ